MSSEREIAGNEERVEALVSRHLVGRASVRELRVRIAVGGIILEGRACTYYAKQLAQQAAAQASGLPVWANNIEVG